MKLNNSKTLYTAFDLYPSSKGSATHMHFMTKTLFDARNGGTLYCLGNDLLPSFQEEEDFRIVRFNEAIPNYLQRGVAYTKALDKYLNAFGKPDLVHYRDFWGGMQFEKEKNIKKVYEVNALMSIELPYRYPNMRLSTLNKIESLEKKCLVSSDLIITPSRVTAAYLAKNGLSDSKIRVIPNTADLNAEVSPNDELKGVPYFIYFGALQKWQGITTILKAISLMPESYKLVICSSNKRGASKAYLRICRRLNIEDRVIWHYQLDKAKLNGMIKGAIASLVPLEECSRNIIQGCSPLKIFESIAQVTPIIASDLPVVREILSDDSCAFIQSGRPEQWARKMLYCTNNLKLFRNFASNARAYFDKCFLKADLAELQRKAYESISAL